MSMESIAQTGSDEPMPESLIELQQLVMGFLLIWDVLGKNYRSQGIIESAALADWARRHQMKAKDAFELLTLAKERMIQNPWVNYMSCRDFDSEGWITIFLMRPNGNTDIMRQIQATLDLRPFPKEEKGDSQGSL